MEFMLVSDIMNMGKIGDVNFIVGRDKNNVIKEVMLKDQELESLSIEFTNFEDSSIEMKNYVRGI